MIDTKNGGVADRLLALLQPGVEAFSTNRVEPAIRRWARSDAQVKHVVGGVDNE